MTSTATSSSPPTSRERYGRERGYGLSSYVDGLQSAGRTEEALALTEESVAVARGLGNPYWIAYSLWIAGMAYSAPSRRRALAAWDEGMAVVRDAAGHVLRRLHRSRRSPAAHVRRGTRRRARVVRRGDHRVPTRRQRAAADHHPRQRAGVVRAPRPARAGRHAARRAGRRAVERAPRPRARRARRPDRARSSDRSAPEQLDRRRRRRSISATPPSTRGSRSTSPAGTRRRRRARSAPAG